MRIVGSAQYGQYSLLLSQCNLIAALGFGWLNQAQLRYYSIDSSQEHYKNNQILSLFYSTLFALLILSLLVYAQSKSNQILVVSILTITMVGGFNYLKTYYQANILPKKIVFLTSFQSLLALFFPLIYIFFLGYHQLSLLLGIASSFFVSILIMLKVNGPLFKSIKTKNNKTIINSIDILKKWFIYGSPLSIWFAAGLSLSYLDRFFIDRYLSGLDLGMYASLQELLVRSFSLTLFPITLALHPRIMNLWNKSKFTDTTSLILKSSAIVIGMGLFIIFVVWKYNDLIFYGIQKVIPQLTIQSKLLILPLFCSGFLWQLSFLTHKMMELKEKTIYMVMAIIPSLLINIIGNIYFLPKLGGVATAYTALFSALVYCIITGIYSIYSIYKINTL